jgi:trehalose 6-phosphate synthase/phosphatase
MWIREFEIEIEEEEEEKENEENEEEEDEEEEDEEEEEEEDSDEIKISKKDRKKYKLNRNVKSLLSLKENNDKDNRKMKLYKEKIKNEIDNLRKKYNDNNIISVEFSSDENTFNIYRRLAMFKHSNIFLYPFFLEGQGIYVKEFISMKSENGQKYGAIVNENMAFMGIRSVIKVNPFDCDIIAKALNQINSWSFNKIRYDSDINSLKKNSAEKWLKGFLLDIKRVMLNDSNNKCKIGLGRDIAIMKLNENFRQLRKAKLMKYFKNSNSRLLIFNYENTLQDFDETNCENGSDIFDNKSNRKNYTKRIIKIISSFCQDPQNMVFIISKYNYESLFKIFGKVKNLGICGENGFFYKYPGKKEVIPLIKNVDWTWKETVVKIMRMFSERTEESKIIENKSNIAWSFPDNYFGNVLADELKSHLRTILNTPTLDISNLNNGILEVKPKNVNKGAFLAKILQDNFEEKKFDLIFIVGCDDTDEEMFKYLQSAKKYFHNFVDKIRIVSTTINKHTSLAHYYFNEINDCIENLELMSKGKYKDLEEESEDYEPRKQIFHFKEDE